MIPGGVASTRSHGTYRHLRAPTCHLCNSAPTASHSSRDYMTDKQAYSRLASPERTQAEPQNPLTLRFTEAEWKALRKLRPLLPEIRRIAYDGSDTPKTFSIWGVTIDPMDPAADARASVVLVKFLRARKLDVGATKTLLIDLLRWRQEVNIDELVKRTFPPFKMCIVAFGKDKAGRPVIYSQVDSGSGRYLRKELEEDSKTVILRAARNWENSVRKLDYESVDRMTRVIDVGPVLPENGSKSQPQTNAAYKRVVKDYYPDFLGSVVAINAPSGLVTSTRISSFFGTPKDGAIQWVGKGQGTIAKKLLKIIDADQLPKQYGGEADGFSWPELGSPSTQVDAAAEKRV
ncbi:uncharacterized protein PHACADRAFT_213912 [Phanerochaete carnosa HHB-10118-sp]|uniref:CRAL-TRIO domain-containing protein n=1 Tax=Phanerochaete carnosa (strain HHB-10118-sp) TaxID=650164 RepID=K5VUA1_PHACS|nr:uncharacterized protein PHACADRAFT_213912 [Phanerochaete carnosa HHB-10118-sp]EKM50159.1 hypothetical protein PHACADRAFT_213912 [Phanerochaete carnosa HHB-10118-sp]